MSVDADADPGVALKYDCLKSLIEQPVTQRFDPCARKRLPNDKEPDPPKPYPMMFGSETQLGTGFFKKLPWWRRRALAVLAVEMAVEMPPFVLPATWEPWLKMARHRIHHPWGQPELRESYELSGAFTESCMYLADREDASDTEFHIYRGFSSVLSHAQSFIANEQHALSFLTRSLLDAEHIWVSCREFSGATPLRTETSLYDRFADHVEFTKMWWREYTRRYCVVDGAFAK